MYLKETRKRARTTFFIAQYTHTHTHRIVDCIVDANTTTDHISVAWLCANGASCAHGTWEILLLHSTSNGAMWRSSSSAAATLPRAQRNRTEAQALCVCAVAQLQFTFVHRVYVCGCVCVCVQCRLRHEAVHAGFDIVANTTISFSSLRHPVCDASAKEYRAVVVRNVCVESPAAFVIVDLV